MDAQSRSSLSSNHRSSLNIGRTSFQVSTRGMNSIDNFMMQDSSETSELDEIAMSSRKSLHLQQAKKYGYEVNSSKNSSEPQIPPDSLILNEEFVLEKTLEHIEEYSTEGLRTLMYSFRWLDKAQFEDWSAKYTEAKTSLVDRSKKIETIGALLECQLELCGATAIEDKLQHGVPEAIEKLRKAGIKLWMLTGDKRETAINIGHSCSLIKDYSTVIILSNEDEENIATKITAATLEVDAGNIAHCVVVVDGSTLSEIESDLTTMTVFVELGVKADSVICCRASPSQKATMVSYVRRYNTSKVTLAIGDGANDIAMIQSADIGVGITGKEGFQAARASDYSIAQFRYLLKLLLVHGRYNYERTSKFVLCTFYKELLFYLSQALYQRQNLFTGSSQYESWSLSMFNTLFTSLPVLCIGMFEKDLRPSTLLAVPELYSKGRNYESFNLRLFVYWVLLGAAQSTALSFLAWNVYGTNATKDNTTMALGVLMFTTLVVVINVKCNVLEMHYVTKIPLISMVVSLGGWMIWNLLISALYKTKDSKIFYVVAGFREEFGRDVTWWGSLLVLIVIGVGIDVIARCIRVEFWPTESETFQILERIPSIRKRLEFRAFGELYHSWTWPHESQIRAESNGPYSRIAKIRSFVKKGGLGPSAATRKRSSTLPTPTELPPGSPSSVTRAADLDYDEEMLPSGKVIRKRQRANTKGRLRRLLSFDDVIPEAEEDSEDDVNRIISDRMRQLERDSSAC
ncbi:unnamed protein product [Kuraishia capsulata CBS 1993]|uniref:Phospholipid-transporting ATPase n=1 Tax=Kuraishia capsulata CBS 1993 TaxID=1382522 RepID=W6MWH8_9ASCO|nr:uncharacterized protein KUCA_T00003448001 [Kuraishia capsulata CBS 1993]CDK27470.1 unnamed protein product [Kuraishia capsulata CBS 1993]